MKTLVRTVVFSALLLTLPVLSAAKLCFTATIDGAQAGTGSGGTGVGLFILNDAETILTYKITFSGLTGVESVSHIHSNAEGNGVVRDLPLGSPKIGLWTDVDTQQLTAARVQDLKDGLLYVNIHSNTSPGGEIRGQILSSACNEQCFESTIDGAQAGTASGGTGTGTFILNHTETELSYDIEFSGLSASETAAHIHNENAGNGIVKNLGTGSPKTGVWTAFEAAPELTTARLQDLKNEALYVNIHSGAFPAGEIRGQIVNANCAAATVAGTPMANAATLEQNAPNPFNPSTTIAFSLVREMRARLDVFDAGGRFVVTLTDGVMPEGRTVVEWNGRNANGGTVASGIYFYRLVAGDFTQTRKMVLLK